MTELDNTPRLSMLSAAQTKHRAVAQGDMRVGGVDVNDLGALSQIYEKEFSNADELMRAKTRLSSSQIAQRLTYDYDHDWRFKEWERDQQELKQRLGIHWIDELLDRPSTMLTYFMRVGTSLGLMYGVYTTLRLWKGMDKAYCRLHGVTVGSLALTHVSNSIIKGTLCAVLGVLGGMVGESSSRLVSLWIANEVWAPKREWYHVTAAFTGSGVLSGVAFAAMHYSILSGKGMAMVVSAASFVGLLAGCALGFGIYKPMAALRTHRIDEPHWRPWNERKLTLDGARQVRGRYM